ncbi:hypothetical protein ABZ568_00805 [Streptomyces olindensis]|uniref:Conjugal transfer protein n=1 Tax=Streptomyces olindensis TaxID=358823 RepID=A0ABV2XLY5_9ACTN
MTETRTLTGGQRTVLIAATLPMVGFGGLGGWGTFTNVLSEFGPDRQATAFGVVAAGEGATLVLALVMLLLTMFGQAAPWPVRAGLWSMPAAASVTGVILADSLAEAVVYGITPMAMCVAAEGLGLVARRLVVYRTHVDVEAQRRNAQIMRRIAYHRARSKGADPHPWVWVRRWSALAAWGLLRRAGEGDVELGVELIGVQRVKLTEGAGLALGDMLAGGSSLPALPPAAEPAPVHEPEFEPEPVPEPREPEPTREPEPEPAHEPEPEHEREPEPEQQRGETTNPAGLSLTKAPPSGEQSTGGADPGQAQREPRDPREPGPAPAADLEQRQILMLATRLQNDELINGKKITKNTAAPVLGVSVATAQRRLTQARRVVKLAGHLKAGERLTPASAAPLLGVDERTAGARLNEARQLLGEGQGLYL